jgi:Holliday junction resolvase RusA-like endonuclease
MQGVAFEVHLDFQMPIPASWSQKRRALVTGMDVVAHVKRPDLDNLEKAVLDGLNGVVWNDDAQVFRLTKVKRYGLEPKTTVRITWHE